MHVLIERNGVKRYIETPFAICGSRDDLLQLVRTIERQIDGSFHHGWIDVVDPVKQVSNNPARNWENDERHYDPGATVPVAEKMSDDGVVRQA